MRQANSFTFQADFTEEVNKLAELFNENFENYADEASQEVKDAGPVVDKKGGEGKKDDKKKDSK